MYIYDQYIAGIQFRTESDIQIPIILQQPHKSFCSLSTEPEVTNVIRCWDTGGTSLDPLEQWEQESLMNSIGWVPRWVDSPVFRNSEIRQALQECLDHPKHVNVNLAWNRVILRDFYRNVQRLFYPPENKTDFSTPQFIARYRNLLATFMPNFDSVLCHAAGLVIDEISVLMLASDGGGKTSVVNHSRGLAILSDDQVVLRKEGDDVFVHSTPFGPRSDGPRQAKLGGLFVLEKASIFKIVPIKPIEVFSFLWKENSRRLFISPRDIAIRVLDLFWLVSHQVPAYRMMFPKNYIDWESIASAVLQY